MSWLLLLPTIVLLTWGLTGLVLRRAPLDHPNDRSSHSVPTPRGGGIAVVGVTLAGTVAGLVLGVVERPLGFTLLGGGLLVAVVGWWDDRWGLRARTRLLAHALAAGWALFLLGGYPSLSVGSGALMLGAGGAVLAGLAIMWSTNLFNFMDGIDGLAGVEAVMLAIGGGLLLIQRGGPGLILVPLLLAGSAGGFLAWNWAPARVFLGDVGSGFLGYAFGILALWGENAHGVPALHWAALGMVFMLDATVTLVRRLHRGERVALAHRSHAYQRLVLSGWSHARVSVGVMVIDLALIATILLLPPLTALGVAVLLAGAAYIGVERRRPM